MSAAAGKGFTKSVPFWAGLALTGAINAATTMILMIVPAGLFFQTMRAASSKSACAVAGEAQRRYLKRVAIFSSAYLVVLALQVSLLADADPSLAVRAGISVLPGLAVLGIFWAIGRLIVEEQDEFIRMLVVRQNLVATALALGFATLWGFLEAGEVVPHLEAYWFAVAFFFGQFVGAVSNKLTFGSWGAL